MTPEQLEQIARTFDKAKMASGPHALADWATGNAQELLALAREAIGTGLPHPDLGALAALYPGVEIDCVLAAATEDVRAMRAERSRWANGMGAATKDAAIDDAGNVKHDGVRSMHRTVEDATADAIAAVGYPLAIDALRPFAGAGAPIVLERLDAVAAEAGIDTEILPALPVFAVQDADGGMLVEITREQLIRAHDLVNQADGGGGA